MMKKIRLKFSRTKEGNLIIVDVEHCGEKSYEFHIYQSRLLEIAIKYKKLKPGDMIMTMNEYTSDTVGREIFRRIVK